jgi:hypothetical protein
MSSLRLKIEASKIRHGHPSSQHRHAELGSPSTAFAANPAGAFFRFANRLAHIRGSAAFFVKKAPGRRAAKKLLLLAGIGACFAPIQAADADALRPAIATPLAAAERDLAAHDFTAALHQLARAAAVPGKSAYETLTIGQVRAAIDAARQDFPAAAADDTALINSGQLPPAQLTLLAEAIASYDYQDANYAGTIATVKADLPGDPRFTTLLLQSYLKLGQCDALADAVSRLGTPPPENDLQMVAYCDATANNTAGYTQAMTQLVADYPSPQYWSRLLGMAQANPAFTDALALDFFRLKLAAGVAAAEPEYMDMAQAALQDGLPNEAAKILRQGDAAGVLGSGPDAARQTRLQALAAQRQAAANAAAAAPGQDQPTLFDVGFNEVDGGNPAGLTLMANAIRSGQLVQPAQAELELGIAYAEAGQTANAHAMFKAVQGGNAKQLAMLWTYLK